MRRESLFDRVHLGREERSFVDDDDDVESRSYTVPRSCFSARATPIGLASMIYLVSCETTKCSRSVSAGVIEERAERSNSFDLVVAQHLEHIEAETFPSETLKSKSCREIL